MPSALPSASISDRKGGRQQPFAHQNRPMTIGTIKDGLEPHTGQGAPVLHAHVAVRFVMTPEIDAAPPFEIRPFATLVLGQRGL